MEDVTKRSFLQHTPLGGSRWAPILVLVGHFLLHLFCFKLTLSPLHTDTDL